MGQACVHGGLAAVTHEGDEEGGNAMSQNDAADVHADLRASVRAFTQREGGLQRVRAVRERSDGFDRAAWTKMAELGWAGILMPEDAGGTGLGLSEMASVARELGRALAPEPLVPIAVLAVRALVHGEINASGAGVLERIARGDCLPALAWQEANGVLDSVALRTRAVRDGREVIRLDGTKCLVAYGSSADGFLVSARARGGIGVYWVARDAAGMSYRSRQRADGTEHGVLELMDVRIRRRDELVVPMRGAAALARALDEAVLMTGAELLGVAERALEITLDYLRMREQFGKPIGGFQALQHRCVDLFIQKELCVSALAAALQGFDTAGGAQRRALASRVKARCSDNALKTCREAIQMHGAIGFTDECDIGLYLKRALVLAAWLGNGQVHRRRYAGALGIGAEQEARR